MALETAMRREALRVAGALHQFASDRGWPREDYRIFMNVNPEWNLINVTFASDHFKTLKEDDEYKNFDDVMDHLEQQLRDEPNLYLAVGLVLTPNGGRLSSGGAPPGPDEEEVPAELLNPGV